MESKAATVAMCFVACSMPAPHLTRVRGHDMSRRAQANIGRGQARKLRMNTLREPICLQSTPSEKLNGGQAYEKKQKQPWPESDAGKQRRAGQSRSRGERGEMAMRIGEARPPSSESWQSAANSALSTQRSNLEVH